MKLASVHQADDLQSRIKDGFSEFNRKSSPSRARKYPNELKALVTQALLGGISPVTLGRLTGVSSSAIHKWKQSAVVAQPLDHSLNTVVAPRRLEVVNDQATNHHSALVVRLPSGISIEFANALSFNRELLMTLATLEVNHAASR